MRSVFIFSPNVADTIDNPVKLSRRRCCCCAADDAHDNRAGKEVVLLLPPLLTGALTRKACAQWCVLPSTAASTIAVAAAAAGALVVFIVVRSRCSVCAATSCVRSGSLPGSELGAEKWRSFRSRTIDASDRKAEDDVPISNATFAAVRVLRSEGGYEASKVVDRAGRAAQEPGPRAHMLRGGIAACK